MAAESCSIECRHLKVRRGATVALEEVTLCIEAHEWVYVMGPSGGGKSTLLRAIAGLEVPATGEICLSGRRASGEGVMMPPHERGIGMVFQDAPLWPHLTVEANIALPLSGRRMRKGETRERTKEWLKRLELEGVARSYPGEISGGEARRAAIAQALITQPKILLLDEPTNHLDLHLRVEVINLLRKLHETEGLTTVCVTHQPEPPVVSGARVCILERGRLTHDGPLGRINPAASSPFIHALRSYIEGGQGA